MSSVKKSPSAYNLNMGMGRKIGFLVFGAIIVAISFYSLAFYAINVSTIDVLYSIIFAATLFALFYIRNRNKPIIFEFPKAGEDARGTYLTFLLVAVFFLVAAVRPALVDSVVSLIWPVLGLGLFVFCVCIYAIVRT